MSRSPLTTAHRASQPVLSPNAAADPATREILAEALKAAEGLALRAVLVEPADGVAIPGYHQRLDCSAEQAGACTAVVFTDAAHRDFVWSWWESCPGLGRRYREFRLPRRGRELRKALTTAHLASAGDPGPLPRDLLMRFTKIQRCGSVSGLRSMLTESLARFAQFDARDLTLALKYCDIEVAGFQALFDRARSFLDDAEAGSDRRRPEMMKDLRAALASVDGSGNPIATLRQLVLQRNTGFVVDHGTESRVCADRLRAWSGLPDLFPALDLNIAESRTSATFPLSFPKWRMEALRFSWRRVRERRLREGSQRGLRDLWERCEQGIGRCRTEAGMPSLVPIRPTSIAPPFWDFELVTAFGSGSP